MTATEQLLETCRMMIGVFDEAIGDRSIGYQYRVLFRVLLDECRAAIERYEAERATASPPADLMHVTHDLGGEG